MSDYTPIDCGIHDHLELTAMRRVPVTVAFVDPQGSPRTLTGVRLDTIRVEDGAEFGIFVDAEGVETAIRLDRLASVGIPGGRLEIRGARSVSAARAEPG